MEIGEWSDAKNQYQHFKSEHQMYITHKDKRFMVQISYYWSFEPKWLSWLYPEDKDMAPTSLAIPPLGHDEIDAAKLMSMIAAGKYINSLNNPL